jgi:L-malate glycosyltransferase
MNKRLHVLYLCSWYPDKKNPSSGIFIQRHARAVSKHANVSVLHIKSDEDRSEQEQLNIRESETMIEILASYPAKSAFWMPAVLHKYIQATSVFNQALRVAENKFGRPDIIQVNVAMPAGLYYLLNRKISRLPLVIAEHWSGYLPEDGRYRGMMQTLFTAALVKRASLILTVSAYLEQQMKAHGLSGRYDYLPNAVDTEVFKLNQQAEKASCFTWLHVSSLDENEKQIMLLFESFKRLLAQKPDTQLLVAGGNNSRIKELESWILQEGLSAQIKLSGSMPPEGIAKLMQTSHAFVLSSKFEGQPCVILESLACGTPVLAPAVGGIPDLINDDNGLTFQPGNSDELLAKMLVLMDHYTKYRSESISQAIREKFSFDSVGHYLCKHYNRILNREFS